MAVIRLGQFKGMAPDANPKTMSEDLGVFASATDTRFGDIRPLKQPVLHRAATVGSTLYKFDTVDTFLIRSGSVDFVRGPIPTDTTERTYYTGDGAPKVTDTSLAVRDLGVPAPTTPLTTEVCTTDELTTLEAAAAKSAAAQQFATIVKSGLTYPYEGVADVSGLVEMADYPWHLAFFAPGTLEGGVFRFDNPDHAIIADSSIYSLIADGGMYCWVHARGWQATPSVTLEQDLLGVKHPETGAALLSTEAAAALAENVRVYFRSNQTERGRIVEQLTPLVTEFLTTITDSTSASQAREQLAEIFFATPPAQKVVDDAVDKLIREVGRIGVRYAAKERG